MQYDDYLAKGYPIGSGIVQGTCRQLVRNQLEGTGMRWELFESSAQLISKGTS
jgi:hypothetical protein